MTSANPLNTTQTLEKPGAERFWDLVTGLTLAHFPLDPHNKEIGEALWNTLFNLPGPRAAKPKGTPEHRFVGTLIAGMLEISTTYFTISEVRKYFRRSPRGIPNFRQSGYLAFVVHAYLNEIYIIEKRMCAYLEKLPRAAAKGSEVRGRLEKIQPHLLKLVKDAFERFRVTRGAHVHQQRFSDEGIESLSSLELINRQRKFPMLESFYRSELRRVRKFWDEKFASNETTIKTVMDAYCDVILQAILKKDGSLRAFL